VGIFPEGEDSRGDHGLGRLAEFRIKGPPPPISPLTSSAPHGRPNLRSRLHFCHAQEGGPRSPQGHVVALEGEGVKHDYVFYYSLREYNEIAFLIDCKHLYTALDTLHSVLWAG